MKVNKGSPQTTATTTAATTTTTTMSAHLQTENK
jgi:hypothetical protein